VASLIWPSRTWTLAFDAFEPGEHTEVLAAPTLASSAG
jgi:hypothetical protein